MPEPASSNRRTLPVLFLGVLVAALDIALVATTLPAIRAAFGVDERSGSWVLGIFVLFTLIGLPLMSKLSDRYGRRIIYTIDLALFIAGAVVVVTASGFGQLMVGRALQGLGASGIFPVASAVIGDTVAPEKRGRMLGILGSVYGLAFILGPILGGILVSFGWNWPFAANLILALGVLIFGARRIPDVRSAGSGALDWGGLAVLTIMLAALSVGMNRIDTGHLVESLTSFRVWPLLTLSLVMAPLFVRIERRAADPFVRISLITRRQVALVCLFATGAGLVEAAFVFMTDFATQALGVSDRRASFMLLPLVFAVAIASPVVGRLLDRIGSRRIVGAGLLSVGAGMAVLGWADPTAGTFYLGSVGIGLGLAGLLGSALSYILLTEASVSERTVAQGINTLFISIGQLLGSAFIGAVAASAALPETGYRRAFSVIAVGMGVLFFFSLLLNRQEVEQAQLRQE